MTGLPLDRLTAAFARRAREGSRVLVPYITAGDPDIETTHQLVLAAARAGADIVELGVPFSDPSADGPVLQRAAERALAGGAHLGKVLALAAAVSPSIPLVLFGYLNPFLQYGFERLAKDAAAAGVSGLLGVDLPPEEAASLLAALRPHGLALVPLITPVTPPERIALASDNADAFAYYVSTTGVTGLTLATADSGARVSEVRGMLKCPLVVGFGVRTPGDAQRLGAAADGVVVGSALVDLAYRTAPTERAAVVEAYLRSLRTAIDSSAALP